MIKAIINAVVFFISSVIYTLTRLFTDFWIVIAVTLLYLSSVLYLKTESLLIFLLYGGVVLYGLREGLRQFKRPSRRNIERFLEAKNHLPRGSLEILDDHLATGKKAYWYKTLEGIRAKIPFLFPLSFSPETGKKDLYALRYIALMLFVYMTFATYPNGWSILRENTIPTIEKSMFVSQEEGLKYTGWIKPPEYTKQAPILLNDQTAQPIILPENSVLELTVSSQDNESLYLRLGEKDEALALEETDSGNFYLKQTLSINDGQISLLDEDKDRLKNWKIYVEEDYKPLISFLQEPRVETGSNVFFHYAVEDDYYPKHVYLDITPLQSNALYPNPESFLIEMPIGVQTRSDIETYWESELLHDFSNHSFSGMPVSFVLRVEDQTGKIAQTSPFQMTIPERSFKNEIAKQIIAIRSNLIDDYSGFQKEAMDELEHILIRPYLYRNDTLVFLSMKSVLTRLYLDRGRDYELKSVASLLWYVAIHIEDGALIEEEQRLRELNQKLAKALGNQDLSNQEVSDLIDQLEQALNEYARKSMQSLLDELRKGDGLENLENLNTALINPEKVSDYLDQMRDLIAKGQKNEAMKMLQDLQNMLASMKAPEPELTAEQKQAIEQYKHLQRIIARQEHLLEKTKSLPTIENSKERYQESQDMSDKQNEVKTKLDETQEKLSSLMPDAAFGQCEMASESMKNATETLEKGDFDAARQSQEDALTALKKAVADAKQAMEQQMGLKINDSSHSLMGQLSPLPGLMQRYQQQDSNLDPFGRDPQNNAGKDGDVSLDNENYTNKIKKIVRELQKRSSETDRSHEELDYIKRLLERF